MMALRPAEVLDRIIEHSGYLKYLEEQAEKAKSKKKKAAEEAGEDEDVEDETEAEEEEINEDDDDDDEEEEDLGSDEEMEDEVDTGGSGTSNAAFGSSNSNREDEKQEKPTATQWPYNFKCKLTGPLKRLQGEAIRWVKENYDPQLGSGEAFVKNEDALGPASLEKLSLAALATPAGVFQIHRMLRQQQQHGFESLHSNLNRTAIEVVLGASACGPAALREFQSFLRLTQSDISDARPAVASTSTKKKNKKEATLSFAEMGVNISTIHAAKGLEWDVVFVPHFNQGFLPAHGKGDDAVEQIRHEVDAANRNGNNAINGNGGIGAMADIIARQGGRERSDSEKLLLAVDEERRLAHVAVTRAKEKLFMSYLSYSDSKGEPLEISPILQTIMDRCQDSVEVEA
jgi:UvrD-like helicase C-terminal domain